MSALPRISNTSADGIGKSRVTQVQADAFDEYDM